MRSSEPRSQRPREKRSRTKGTDKLLTAMTSFVDPRRNERLSGLHFLFLSVGLLLVTTEAFFCHGFLPSPSPSSYLTTRSPLSKTARIRRPGRAVGKIPVERLREEKRWFLTASSSSFTEVAGGAGSEKTPSSQRKRDVDSLEAFEKDVAVVLKDLRGDEMDPTLPKPFQPNPRRLFPSFTKLWTQADWNRHTSRWRYFGYLRTFPRSRLLRRTLPHLVLIVSWSICSVWALSTRPSLPGIAALYKVAWTMTPVSLMSTFVFALETLRSNQGLSRLNEGRVAFGKVVLYTRDMAQLIAACVYPKDRELGLKLTRHVSLFGWLLKKFLRGEEINGTDEDIVRVMLNGRDADYVLRQRKAPVAVVTRLRQVIAHMAEEGRLSTAEEIAMDHTAQELNHCITTTERIVNSPIPVLYTAHLGRLLIFYLLLLPLALRGSNVLNGVATVLTTTAVGYAMLGLDEISHLLEQPFKFMPLYQLSKLSMKDVADALVCQPPSLYDEDDADQEGNPRTPAYW